MLDEWMSEAEAAAEIAKIAVLGIWAEVGEFGESGLNGASTHAHDEKSPRSNFAPVAAAANRAALCPFRADSQISPPDLRGILQVHPGNAAS